MSEAAILRAVYGRHAAKHIARDWGVALATAKSWLAGNFPQVRRHEFTRRIQARAGHIRAELDMIDAQLARNLKRLGGAESDKIDKGDKRRIVALGGIGAGGIAADAGVAVRGRRIAARRGRKEARPLG